MPVIADGVKPKRPMRWLGIILAVLPIGLVVSFAAIVCIASVQPLMLGPLVSRKA